MVQGIEGVKGEKGGEKLEVISERGKKEVKS